MNRNEKRLETCTLEAKADSLTLINLFSFAYN